MLSGCRSVAILQIGHIRALGLDVALDASDPKHAYITGLPYREDDADRAEFLAGELAQQAELRWLP